MERTAKSERDKLIVRVLADTGIRAGELLALRRSDLIVSDRKHYLKIRGKGRKERLAPIPQLYRRLERFATGQDGQLLFLALKRRPGGAELEALTLSGLQQSIRELARQAGIRKRVHPHLFRHSFATWSLQKRMDPIQLAQILGHSSLAVIERNYAHLSAGDAYDSMARQLREE